MKNNKEMKAGYVAGYPKGYYEMGENTKKVVDYYDKKHKVKGGPTGYWGI